jgi:hypothetical protein
MQVDCIDALNAEAQCEFVINVTGGDGCTTPEPTTTTQGTTVVRGSTVADACSGCPSVCYQGTCLATCPESTEVVIVNQHRECYDRPDPPLNVLTLAVSSTVLKINIVPAVDHVSVVNYRLSLVEFQSKNTTALLSGLNYDTDPSLSSTVLVQVADLLPGTGASPTLYPKLAASGISLSSLSSLPLVSL